MLVFAAHPGLIYRKHRKGPIFPTTCYLSWLFQHIVAPGAENTGVANIFESDTLPIQVTFHPLPMHRLNRKVIYQEVEDRGRDLHSPVYASIKGTAVPSYFTQCIWMVAQTLLIHLVKLISD